MDKFFSPSSVAIVGASKNPSKAGHSVLKNFLESRRRGLFKGKIYPINLREKSILGIQCFSSLLEIKEEIDLVVIVVPAKITPKVMREVAEQGSKAVIILSSGFSEVSNIELEKEISKIARDNNIRVIGPNCLGIFDPYSGVDTLFLPRKKLLASGRIIFSLRPKKGKIAIISQSGALGYAFLDYLAERGLGISSFISFGNKCDVDESDILEYLRKDQRTSLILFYCEGIRKGRKFLEVAEKLTKTKPLIVLKAGKKEGGARAIKSHTAAVSTLDEIYEAAFKKVGAIRVKDMQEMFDAVEAFFSQPPPKGEKLAIITEAGGPGVLAIDEWESEGFKIDPFPLELKEGLELLKKKGELPSFAPILNPLDLTGSITARMIEKSMRLVLNSEMESLVLIISHQAPALKEDYVKKVVTVSKEFLKPVLLCSLGENQFSKLTRKRLRKKGIPAYETPERTMRAMKALYRYGNYLKQKGYLDEYLRNFRGKRR